MEQEGISTVTLNLMRELAELTKPPRTLYLRFPYGSPMGKPKDSEQQKKILHEALLLLESSITPGFIKDSEIRYR